KIKFQKQKAEIIHTHTDAQRIYEIINAFTESLTPAEGISMSSCSSQKEYINNVLRIKENIREGDIYELNYCIAYKGSFTSLDPLDIFWRLQEKSPMPFSAFFKAKEKSIIGASPERFLKKTGNKIIAQPIKGTVRRGKSVEE